ncbi:ParB family protein [Serratia fonticola]|uniref:ParB family protein n=1 Tax=Serratia fonticola TaxID=47917 RepID=UPI000414C414|nr:ParB family protein [Serratia fonticola]
MTELTTQDMAALLRADGFKSHGPVAPTLSDPIADTPVVVTLDELLPYSLNPRVTRNPRYNEIKESIRKRGLDAPPAITRRPGEKSYIIRNGGNTRLAILRELWSETRDERFFRIHCLFRPWHERGEIIALTGHLAESDLHGRLTFIERALGIEKARELYELESNQNVSQSELARRLTADGYPISQPHISRMQDAVRYLLPAIPSVLFAGLGRPQVEKLVTLRNAALRTWEAQAASKQLKDDFSLLFQDALALFDDPEKFTVQRLQDELVGQMADLLKADYDELMLQIDDSEAWQRALGTEPQKTAAIVSPANPVTEKPGTNSTPEPNIPPDSQGISGSLPAAETLKTTGTDELNTELHEPLMQPTAVISPAATTERLQSLQQLVAEHSGEVPVPGTNRVQSLPVQAGGLYPISDIWLIEPGLDTPDSLRTHINQLALEIAQEAELSEWIETVESGVGYLCTPSPTCNAFSRAVLSLLSVLSGRYQTPASRSQQNDALLLAADLTDVLLGMSSAESSAARLSDAGMVKLFRLIRLARRIFELSPMPEPHTQGLSDF